MTDFRAGKCKLCLQERSICYSHVIPEFLYLPMYDDKHRLLYLPANPASAVRWEQKGLRDYLLCASCENQFSKHEDYVKYLLYGGRLSVKVENTDIHAICGNVNYRAFKLFQMSILWRAGITSLPFFTQVDLGSHEETLRSMLLSDYPGSSQQYGCAMMALLNEREIFDVVRTPDRIDVDDEDCVRFIMGGFMWLFFLSQPVGDHPMRQFFIQENGRMCLLKDDIRNLEFFGLERRLMAARKGDVEALTDRRKRRS